MASFLTLRDTGMSIGWNRRVATLAARLILKVDTWRGIAACRTFRDRPLLSVAEAKMIAETIRFGGLYLTNSETGNTLN